MLLHTTFYGGAWTSVHKENDQWNLISTKIIILEPICFDYVKRFLFRLFLRMFKPTFCNIFKAIFKGSVEKIWLWLVTVLPSNLITIMKSIAGVIQALRDLFYMY
jgi:hypothetical protein